MKKHTVYFKNLKSNVFEFIKIKSEIIFIVIFIFIWAQVISFIVGSGALWFFTKPVLSKNTKYIAQNVLFSKESEFPVDIIIIGEPNFIEYIKTYFQADTEILTFEYPKTNLKDCLVVLDQINYQDTNAVIVQNMPYFWTRVKSGIQDISIWKAFRKHKYQLFPINDVRLFSETLKNIVNVNKNIYQKNKSKKDSLFGASYAFPPAYTKNLIKSIKRNFPEEESKKILWVYLEDTINSDLDNPKIMDKFQSLINDNKFEPGLGYFIKDAQVSEYKKILLRN